MDENRRHPIPGSEGGSQPFFSPDEKWLAYFAGGFLKKMAVSGGPPASLAPVVLLAVARGVMMATSCSCQQRRAVSSASPHKAERRTLYSAGLRGPPRGEPAIDTPPCCRAVAAFSTRYSTGTPVGKSIAVVAFPRDAEKN
jgi:hypothetical protein